MILFNEIFNKASIYDMLFFNVKSVLIYPTLDNLQINNESLYNRWMHVSEKKYSGSGITDSLIYSKNAPYHPEFNKILAITYATAYPENGQLKRNIKKIANADEKIVLETFMSELNYLSSAATQSTPQFFPYLCGHNITGYDIPFLIKRFFIHADKFEEKNQKLPLILKRHLSAKPWESEVIDTINVWKFGGNDNTSLMLIADHLGLKRTVNVVGLDELSEYYWKNIETNPNDTLNYVALQSATQINLVIQLINKLRYF